MNRPNNIGISDWNELLKKHNNLIPKEVENLLKQNYPIQYLIGNVDFYESNILVNENVLIPRYETELLVSKIIDKIKSKKIDANKIIDLCTGSGAIAINLAKYSNNITGIDISLEALELAKLNSTRNNATVTFAQQDILKDNIKLDHTLIVSNPPYVKYNEYTGPETKYEPKIALYANNNGLEFYKRIIEISKHNNQKDFTIAFEIGATQAEEISNMLKLTFPTVKVEVEKDYNNLDRYIFAYINE